MNSIDIPSDQQAHKTASKRAPSRALDDAPTADSTPAPVATSDHTDATPAQQPRPRGLRLRALATLRSLWPRRDQAPAQPAPAAKPPTPTPARPQQRQRREPAAQLPLPQSEPVQAAPAFEIPPALHKRYLVDANNKYYFRDRTQTLAFEDLGKRLRTTHDDPDVAASMVELAQAKGWSQLRLRGSATFKREAWLAASERGLQVVGHRPSALDRTRLAERIARRAQEQREQAPANQLELLERGTAPQQEAPANRPRARRRATRPEPATPAEPSNATPPAAAERKAQPAERTPRPTARQRQALEQLSAYLRQRGDSAQAIALTMDLAASRMAHHRTHFGELLEHGPARYKHEKDNDLSYYVVLKTSKGKQTIWGIDLQRAITASGAEPGDGIALVRPDHRAVMVSTPERDSAGQATGKRISIESERNSWEVISLDNARDFGHRVPAAAGIAAPVVQACTPAPAAPRRAPEREPVRER